MRMRVVELRSGKVCFCPDADAWVSVALIAACLSRCSWAACRT